MAVSRRSFLTKAALAAGSAAAVSAASAARVIGANDRIRVGLIGCGGVGRGDLCDFLRLKNIEAAALCDIDESQIAKVNKQVVERAARRST